MYDNLQYTLWKQYMEENQFDIPCILIPHKMIPISKVIKKINNFSFYFKSLERYTDTRRPSDIVLHDISSD